MSEYLVVVSLLLLVVAAGVFGIFSVQKASRRRELRRRFGPEYTRAVDEYGSPSVADMELETRAARVRKFHVRDLKDADRATYSHSWQRIQARFVDEPSAAVDQADQLIKTVMRTRGYPIEHFQQRIADLSVDHADVVQHYRAARLLADANRDGRADTEELRQAFVHYRALFAELLGAPPARVRRLEEVRA